MNQWVNFPKSAVEISDGKIKQSPLNNLQKRLTVLLFVQLLLVLGIFAWNQNRQSVPDAQPLLSATDLESDKIVIRDANSNVTLQKVNGLWQLPDLKQLPVDEQKLNDLLDKLKGTKLTWPITTSSTSHERFDVSEKKFQRRVEFYKGDQKAVDLFLGTSPGFKKIHLRKQGEDSVYAVQLNSFEFATGNNDWLKKDLLAFKDAQQITAADFALRKNNNNWEFVNSSDKVDSVKANELANAFANLQIMELANEMPAGDKKIFSLNPGGYQYELVSANTSYFVTRSDKNSVFKLSQYEYDKIVKPTKLDLTAKADAEVSSNPINNVIEQATQGLLNPASTK
jgi:hypothetical protein